MLSIQSHYPPKRVDNEKFGEETASRLGGGLYTVHAGYMSDPQLAARNISDASAREGEHLLLYNF